MDIPCIAELVQATTQAPAFDPSETRPLRIEHFSLVSAHLRQPVAAAGKPRGKAPTTRYCRGLVAPAREVDRGGR